MKRKVILASGFICLLFIFFGLGSLSTLSRLRAAIAQMQLDNEAIQQFGDFDTNMVRAAGEAASFINTRNDDYATETIAALEKAEYANQQLTDLINKNDAEAAQQNALDHLHKHRKTVLDQLEQSITYAFDMIQTNKADRADNQRLLDRVYAYEPDAVHMREEMRMYLTSQRILHQNAIDQSLRVLVILRIFFLLLFLVILISSFIIVQNKVVNPLNLLSEAASTVANGNLESTVAESNRDEIGVLQRAFNKMVRDLHNAFQERDLALEQSLRDKNAAEAANRAKSTFLANMSHELRTPLTAISGWTTILQDQRSGSLNEDQAYGLQVIEHSSNHLLELINDILDLAKIEAGKMELEMREILIEPICRESLESVATLAQRKHIRLRYSLNPQLECIQADPRALKQMLMNLLSNAVKFTGQGGQVGFDIDPDLTGERINFCVWDTGIGIAPEDMKLLFQPFVQIDSSLTRREQGSGLGLVLTHRLTGLHAGEIIVASEPGKGSSFTISLPRAAQQPVKQAELSN